MAVEIRFRDAFRRFIPPWLVDRVQAGLTVGFRFLWAMIAPLDAALEVIVQGMQAAWPGKGTPTALPLLARSRGILRGQTETEEHYAERLRGWLDTWRNAGSAETIARQLHEYLGNNPRVRVVNRAGVWVTVNEDGSVERHTQAWDWDSVSNPERAGFWSEIWIIIYPTQWADAPDYGVARNYGDPSGLGHLCTPQEYDTVHGLISQWKAVHTKVRTVIWTSDTALFDPATPASLPNGTWGTWSTQGSGSRVASGRELVTCRYWEPSK